MAVDEAAKCKGCHRLEQELATAKLLQSKFLDLKEKVVLADTVIQKYNIRCQEVKRLNGQISQTSQVIDHLQSECMKYEKDLMKALSELEPLKQEKLKLQELNEEYLSQIENLSSSLHAAEAAIKQYDFAVTAKKGSYEENMEELRKQVSKKSKEVEKYTGVNEKLNKKCRVQLTQLKRVEKKYLKAVNLLQKFAKILQSRGCLPKRDSMKLKEFEDAHLTIHSEGLALASEEASSDDDEKRNADEDQNQCTIEANMLEEMLVGAEKSSPVKNGQCDNDFYFSSDSDEPTTPKKGQTERHATSNGLYAPTFENAALSRLECVASKSLISNNASNDIENFKVNCVSEPSTDHTSETSVSKPITSEHQERLSMPVLMESVNPMSLNKPQNVLHKDGQKSERVPPSLCDKQKLYSVCEIQTTKVSSPSIISTSSNMLPKPSMPDMLTETLHSEPQISVLSSVDCSNNNSSHASVIEHQENVIPNDLGVSSPVTVTSSSPIVNKDTLAVTASNTENILDSEPLELGTESSNWETQTDLPGDELQTIALLPSICTSPVKGGDKISSSYQSNVRTTTLQKSPTSLENFQNSAKDLSHANGASCPVSVVSTALVETNVIVKDPDNSLRQCVSENLSPTQSSEDEKNFTSCKDSQKSSASDHELVDSPEITVQNEPKTVPNILEEYSKDENLEQELSQGKKVDEFSVSQEAKPTPVMNEAVEKCAHIDITDTLMGVSCDDANDKDLISQIECSQDDDNLDHIDNFVTTSLNKEQDLSQSDNTGEMDTTDGTPFITPTSKETMDWEKPNTIQHNTETAADLSVNPSTLIPFNSCLDTTVGTPSALTSREKVVWEKSSITECNTETPASPSVFPSLESSQPSTSISAPHVFSSYSDTVPFLSANESVTHASQDSEMRKEDRNRKKLLKKEKKRLDRVMSEMSWMFMRTVSPIDFDDSNESSKMIQGESFTKGEVEVTHQFMSRSSNSSGERTDGPVPVASLHSDSVAFFEKKKRGSKSSRKDKILLHQQSGGFEVPSDILEAMEEVSETPSKDVNNMSLVRCSDLETIRKDPQCEQQLQTPSSSSPMFNADIRHDSATDSFQIKLSLPSSEESLSVHLELNTRSKEVNLSWKPEKRTLHGASLNDAAFVNTKAFSVNREPSLCEESVIVNNSSMDVSLATSNEQPVRCDSRSTSLRIPPPVLQRSTCSPTRRHSHPQPRVSQNVMQKNRNYRWEDEKVAQMSSLRSPVESSRGERIMSLKPQGKHDDSKASKITKSRITSVNSSLLTSITREMDETANLGRTDAGNLVDVANGHSNDNISSVDLSLTNFQAVSKVKQRIAHKKRSGSVPKAALGVISGKVLTDPVPVSMHSKMKHSEVKNNIDLPESSSVFQSQKSLDDFGSAIKSSNQQSNAPTHLVGNSVFMCETSNNPSVFTPANEKVKPGQVKLHSSGEITDLESPPPDGKSQLYTELFGDADSIHDGHVEEDIKNLSNEENKEEAENRISCCSTPFLDDEKNDKEEITEIHPQAPEDKSQLYLELFGDDDSFVDCHAEEDIIDLTTKDNPESKSEGEIAPCLSSLSLSNERKDSNAHQYEVKPNKAKNPQSIVANENQVAKEASGDVANEKSAIETKSVDDNIPKRGRKRKKVKTSILQDPAKRHCGIERQPLQPASYPDHFWKLGKSRLHKFEQINTCLHRLLMSGSNKTQQKFAINDALTTFLNPMRIPSADNIIATTLLFLGKTHRNPFIDYLSNKAQPPLVSEFEAQLVQLFINLDARNKPHLNCLVEGFTTAMLAHSMTKDFHSLYAISQYCRMYTLICKKLCAPEKVVVYCYDLVLMKLEFIPFLLASVCCVWPEIFTIYLKQQDGLAMFWVLLYALGRPNSLNNTLNTQSLTILKNIGHVEPVLNKTANDITKDLVQSLLVLEKKSSDERERDVHCLVKSFLMLAKCEGWQWTLECLLGQFLWPLLHSWGEQIRSSPDESSFLRVCDEAAACVVEFCGHIGSLCSKEEKNNKSVGVLTILQALLSLEVAGGAQTLQVIAFHSLFVLMTQGFPVSAHSLGQWFIKHCNKIKPQLENQHGVEFVKTLEMYFAREMSKPQGN